MLQKLIAEPTHTRTFTLILLGELSLLSLSWSAAPPLGAAALLYLGGLLAWTLAEYFLHRVLFHLPLSSPLRVLGATLHAAHHARPNEPPITKPPALTLGAFALSSLAAYVAVGSNALPFFSGMLLGYFFYEVSHVASHVLTPSEHPLPHFQASHLTHHQRPSTRFGITSPLWDYLFGSLT